MPQLTLRVYRHTPGEDALPRYDSHTLTVTEHASVLDALLALQSSSAPDLAFRFSCRVGMCGSCALLVNGRERLACSTTIAPLGPTVRLEPIRNLPVIRDLVVDLAPLFESYQRVLPHFIPHEPTAADFAVLPEDSATRQNMDHQPQCIDCGACYSSCSLVTLHPNYLGPMALHRALQLIADPRDAAHAERLAIVAGESGAFRCHTLGNCRDVCPRGISPAHSIERLKSLSVKRFFRLAFRDIWLNT
ncbi:MAG: succinate dehydrogenase/fumarate reductase iron-sulfur subunit [Chloroflexi bacterium]|nr:MAG: succinate dehydrogenase/fumarate reductase iron-sulfur subunit [Chloroflexota bacterium]